MKTAASLLLLVILAAPAPAAEELPVVALEEGKNDINLLLEGELIYIAKWPLQAYRFEVSGLSGGRLKTIFGGAAGKFIPDEQRRGANGCMPACELGDILAMSTSCGGPGRRRRRGICTAGCCR